MGGKSGSDAKLNVAASVLLSRPLLLLWWSERNARDGAATTA